MSDNDRKKALEPLLWRSESETLDFKRAQYRFRGTDGDKGEFVKDVLAMANAWRDESAYILIGVDERLDPGPARVVGEVDHPDEANLQQLVNGDPRSLRTNRPVQFSYEVVLYDGKKVGMLRIPVQKRPLFLRARIGGAAANVVYVRRGSSTAEADPDEQARMGAADSQDILPALVVEYADVQTHRPLGRTCRVMSEVLSRPDDAVLAAFTPEPDPRPTFSRHVGDPVINEEYASELYSYTAQRAYMKPVRLIARNLSSVVASDVNVILTLPANLMVVEYAFRLLSKPARRRNTWWTMSSPLAGLAARDEPDITIEERAEEFKVTFEALKIQPKAEVVSPVFFLGARAATALDVPTTIYSDEGEPQRASLKLELDVSSRQATTSDLTGAQDGLLESAADEDE